MVTISGNCRVTNIGNRGVTIFGNSRVVIFGNCMNFSLSEMVWGRIPFAE